MSEASSATVLAVAFNNSLILIGFEFQAIISFRVEIIVDTSSQELLDCVTLKSLCNIFGERFMKFSMGTFHEPIPAVAEYRFHSFQHWSKGMLHTRQVAVSYSFIFDVIKKCTQIVRKNI